MKKLLLVASLSFLFLSCDKTAEVKEQKTAYIDTAKLMEGYTEAKDVDEKFKAKKEEVSRKLEVEEANFKSDADYFQKNAQANGQAWAQQKGAELQKRQQQLQYAAQTLAQQIQAEYGTEMDSVVSGVKKFIKEYGKKEGYAYIYGTGESATVLYAEDKFDLTDEMIKMLNDKYASAAKKEETPAAPAKK